MVSMACKYACIERREGKARGEKARQGKSRGEKASQGKARQEERREGKEKIWQTPT